MQRRKKPSEGSPVPPHAEYAELLEKYPNLAQWFTDATYDDGEPRPGGWVCVSCRGGSWHGTMKDAGEALSISLAAPSPLLLLDLMEHALVDPAAPWRADPSARGPATRKKK